MLSNYQTIVDDLVRDDANQITDTQRDTAIASAIARYSKDRPLKKVEDVTSAGGHYLPLPSAWELDFSAIDSLETPIGRVPTELIPHEEYAVYRSPSGLQIKLIKALAANTQVRVTFIVQHAISNSVDTVPVVDREVVCCLAAASLSDQLAAFYSGQTDSTINADAVQHQSKAGEYASRAKSLRKRYLDELGVEAKKNVASGVVVSFPSGNSLGGSNLTKGQRLR